MVKLHVKYCDYLEDQYNGFSPNYDYQAKCGKDENHFLILPLFGYFTMSAWVRLISYKTIANVQYSSINQMMLISIEISHVYVIRSTYISTLEKYDQDMAMLLKNKAYIFASLIIYTQNLAMYVLE